MFSCRAKSAETEEKRRVAMSCQNEIGRELHASGVEVLRGDKIAPAPPDFRQQLQCVYVVGMRVQERTRRDFAVAKFFACTAANAFCNSGARVTLVLSRDGFPAPPLSRAGFPGLEFGDASPIPCPRSSGFRRPTRLSQRYAGPCGMALADPLRLPHTLPAVQRIARERAGRDFTGGRPEYPDRPAAPIPARPSADQARVRNFSNVRPHSRISARAPVPYWPSGHTARGRGTADTPPRRGDPHGRATAGLPTRGS